MVLSSLDKRLEPLSFLVVYSHKAAVAAPWSPVPFESTVVTMCRWSHSWKSALAFTAQLAGREWESEVEGAQVPVAKAMLLYCCFSYNCCFFSGHRYWDDPGGAGF